LKVRIKDRRSVVDLSRLFEQLSEGETCKGTEKAVAVVCPECGSLALPAMKGFEREKGAKGAAREVA